MCHIGPLIIIFNLFTRVETDSIAPMVPYLANLKFQLLRIIAFCDFVRVNYKLQEELVKVCFYVDTLELRIDILIDKHEV